MPCKRINTAIKVFYVICCLIVVIPKFWLKRQCFGVQVPQLFPIITEAPFIKTVLFSKQYYKCWRLFWQSLKLCPAGAGHICWLFLNGYDQLQRRYLLQHSLE